MKTNSIYQILNEINEIETLETLRTNFNETIDNHKKKLQIIEESNGLKDTSYLFIKESFDNFSETLFKTKNGRKLINKYINEHKSNKSLQKLFMIYENLISADKRLDANEIIKEMKGFVGNLNTDSLNKGINNLLNILKEAYIEVGETAKSLIAENKDYKLDESIKYIFTNNKKLDNITYYSLCVNEISNFINNNTINEIKFKNSKNIDSIVEEFNKKCTSDDLTDEEIAIIKEVRDAENKSEVFEKYKNACINTIDEAIKNSIEQDTCNQLFEFKTRISKKEYNPETLGLDVANFIELEKTIKD